MDNKRKFLDDENEEDLSKILNIKIAEIDDFENKFTSKIESAIQKHDFQQNLKRLYKCQESIKQLEDRIAGSAASASRIAKLFERLDELKVEELQLLELVDATDSSTETRENDNENPDKLDIARKGPFIDITGFSSESDEEESAKTATLMVSSEIKDAYEIAAHHHIIDDFSNIDFNSRIEDWLACEKFSDWRQHKSYFTSRFLSDQVSFELTCFDIVTLHSGNFRVPKCLWDELFDYQREGVEWLLKLWEEGSGGVLGDEMGLGKTVQVVAFLAGLQISGKLAEPNLIVAPSTLLRQWIRELNTWWPPLRTVLLHSSSSAFSETGSVKSFISSLYPKTHVFVTSYGTCSSPSLRKILTTTKWNNVILDEGHKIRNPEAQITLICKQLRSSSRFVLSGTPIQNNLTELWSLFDFVQPELLGSLPLFKAELALPINIGGYTNASLFQVQTSYKCACTLRDLIKPFLLRRLKRCVLMNKGNLPDKKEEIVFCKITPYQKRLYESFISSEQVDAIIERKRNLLAGIDILRKISNHPDLLNHVLSDDYESDDNDYDEEGGDTENGRINYSTLIKTSEMSSDLLKCFNGLKRPEDPTERSGKLKVLSKILELWKRQGHRALIFCQTRQMLNLIEEFLSVTHPEYKYMRMDGTTPIRQRLQMVDKFNAPNSPFFLFLLTTRVGGLGINLTGANRVVIYDPDWNPSTDLQARERVYRLGQTRSVSILRLITAGTIEEKIYHRQIFKQFLTQRILEDPKQTRFFKATDLHDLFELNDAESEGDEKSTETADMFAGLEDEIIKKMNGRASGQRNSEELSNEKDVILDDLLDMVGVHSTLPTSNLTETIRPEYALIQKEAEEIAQGALEALKRNRNPRPSKATKQSSTSEVDHYNEFKPNWGNRFGPKTQFGFGDDEDSSRAGLDEDSEGSPEITAADILAAINERKSRSSLNKSNDKNLQLALDLVDYMNRVGGKVSSDRLAHAFRAQVQSSESAVVFRSLLKKVANFDKRNRIWKLEGEFNNIK